MRYLAAFVIASLIGFGFMLGFAVSTAGAQSWEPFDLGIPAAPVGDAHYWTDVLGPCYVAWYGTDYRHCGVRTRRLAAYGRARPRSGRVVYRRPAKRTGG